ncbi:MAG: protein-glutamate O-methyltransferase CheR [Planctomycetota bacterium]
MTSAVKSMTDSEFKALRDVIYKRSGIAFQDTKKYVLESRLSKRLEELELEDFNQYVQFLSFGPYASDEFQEMFNRITINETCFFRNEPQLEAFENIALNELIKARSATKRLRIWSAACSTGEEPYTLAMLVSRTLGVRLSDWNIEILGTDISEKALNIAEKGEYGQFSFRGVSPLHIKRYFNEENGVYRVNDDIKSMVRLDLHNLKETLAARRFGTWDVIFCRNVMIYFDADMKKQCVQLYHDQLADDGYLFIGHSETIRDLGVPFEPLGIAQAFAYSKQKPAGAGGLRVAS